MTPPSLTRGRVSLASAQGSRDHQEDRAFHDWIASPRLPGGGGWLLAVFDGHGGAETAERARLALPSLLEAALGAFPASVPAALRGTLRGLHELTQNDDSGSTASLAIIPQSAQEIHWAVLGDSPLAALDSEGRLHIGPEHNVRTNLKERAAAEARGGFYQGGYLEDSEQPGAGLQMARSLGDRDLARVLSREPEIQTIALGGRGAVLVGSDGLLSPEVAGDAQLARIMARVSRGADAQALVRDALDQKTGDNVTAIVWKSV